MAPLWQLSRLKHYLVMIPNHLTATGLIMNRLFELTDGALAERLLMAFLFILGAYLLRWLVNRIFFGRLIKLAEKTRLRYDDLFLEAIKLPISAAIFSTGIFLALGAIGLPEEPWNLSAILKDGWEIALLALIIWTLYRLIDVVVAIAGDLMSKEDELTSQQFTPIIRSSLRFVLLALAGVLIVQNLGYQVSSLITGLGIGGLAVALAAQDTLANVFGTVVMLTDRPFKVGDWIQMGDVEGTVEEIGFRATRIRTFAKSLIVVPNKLMTDRHLENWSAMPKRRIKMTLGLTYGTTPEQMEAFVSGVKELLTTDPAVDQSFHMVNFVEFGAHSLDILVYFFTVTTNWAEYMAERQRINLEFMKIARRVGVDFAFPTQTIHFGDALKTENISH